MTRARFDLERGLWPEALVAALASLSVAWPLTTLLEQSSWVAPAVVLVAAVAVTGAVLRSVDLGPSWVSIGQLLVGVLGLGWVYLPETLWWGLPTADSARAAAGLLAEAGSVLRTYAAPAPTTVAVSFLVVSVLLLTAVAVDTLAVTGGAPAAAGVPLTAAFFVSVSNSGQAMSPWFFLATAAAWMVMMAQQGRRLVDGWPSRDRRELVGGDNDVSLGRTGQRTVARVLGVLALVAAVVGAALLPHLPPTFLAEGLGRASDANDLAGGSGGQVSFVETMDPSEDLLNQSTDPVLTYTSSASTVEPLKVTATADYVDGAWQPPQPREQDLVRIDSTGLGILPGLSGEVSATAQTIRVSRNVLQPPHVAAPTPMRQLDTGTLPWTFDRRTGVARLTGETSVDTYTAGYYSYVGLDAMPESVGSEQVSEVEGYGEELLEVPPEAQPAVAALAEEVVGDETRPLDQAVLIQNHLRSGQFLYSLELAPNQPDVPDEPISQFLANRQGYCVQFATAMVMMARSEGIPARMAVGFLPGTLDEAGGARSVVASDAHTWPELYLSGLGWTRFEPTPGSRTGTAPGFTRSDELSEEVPTPTLEPDALPEPEPPADAADGGAGDSLGETLLRLAWVLGAVAVLAALMMLVPLAARWHRRRELRRAETPQDEVEVQWQLLTRALADLGVPPPEPRSPRAMRAHYTEHAVLDRRADEALGRVTATLERARYAPVTSGAGSGADSGVGRDVGTDHAATETATRPDTVERDVDTVVQAVRDTAPGTVRLRAALLPGTGLTGIREWLRRS
ncbi:transglutaminase family protein [Ornithinimicrobium sediminis]|uniref:transglutaminase family protein n=1 Tax=Ornithinimicrobium sediminis TaxID=2904603 RepID=UPI001E5A1AF8|nr:DUF3488 and transglutaminase-like domain-containing protein [Ornithinimicrobium sediminis]